MDRAPFVEIQDDLLNLEHLAGVKRIRGTAGGAGTILAYFNFTESVTKTGQSVNTVQATEGLKTVYELPADSEEATMILSWAQTRIATPVA